MIPLWKGKNPIYLRVIRSKVKVTIIINIIFDNSLFPHDNFSSVYWIFNKLGHMIPLWKGKNPIYFGVKSQGHRYYKKNFWQQDRFRTITLVLYIGTLPSLATWFPCGRGRTLFILGSLLLYLLIIYIDRRILWCTHFCLYCLGYWLLQLYEPSYSYVFVLLLMDYMCILKYCKKRQHRSWYVDKSSGIPALQKATCHTLYFVTRVFIYMYILYK